MTVPESMKVGVERPSEQLENPIPVEPPGSRFTVFVGALALSVLPGSANCRRSCAVVIGAFPVLSILTATTSQVGPPAEL